MLEGTTPANTGGTATLGPVWRWTNSVLCMRTLTYSTVVIGPLGSYVGRDINLPHTYNIYTPHSLITLGHPHHKPDPQPDNNILISSLITDNHHLLLSGRATIWAPD